MEPQPYHFDYTEAIQEGNYAEKGKKITVQIQDSKDLETPIIKADSCSVFIPEIQFEGAEGTGKFTTIENYLLDVLSSLESCGFFSSNAVLESLSELAQGSRPFTIIFDDPLGNSQVRDEDTSENITVEHYERSWKQNTEYGIEPKLEIDPFVGADGEDKLVDLILNSKKIVGLTGAGISTESGIPSFRGGPTVEENKTDENGEQTPIWLRYNADDMHIDRFTGSEESRRRYWRMNRDLRAKVLESQPNPSHQIFTLLHKMGKLHSVITQNIDGLHQIAGLPTEKIRELHGTMHTISCLSCKTPANDFASVFSEVSDDEFKTPVCDKCGGLLRPDTVAFGQKLDDELFAVCKQDVSECDLLIVMGTSLVVQPANQLPGISLNKRVPLVLANQGDTQYDQYATVHLYHNPCGRTMASVIDKLAERGFSA